MIGGSPGHTASAPALCALAFLALAGCARLEAPPTVAGGNAARGQLLLEQYDCGSCHVIPGVRRAHGATGPTLERFAQRVYIAGEVPNQPSILVQWLQSPHSLVPDTTMPEQAVPEAHARDMAAWLMGLR